LNNDRQLVSSEIELSPIYHTERQTTVYDLFFVAEKDNQLTKVEDITADFD